jgi:hypothetical protein
MNKTLTTERLKVLSTPGFARWAHDLSFGAWETLKLAGRLTRSGRGSEPTWIVGDTETEAESFEDGGRTLRIPAPFRFYAIRDDHERECECGCEGAMMVTFLLPEEY